ncbi:phosphatase 2C-like domain-containing protein [Powellomyces hirtus]|nr:phosphatase 2C-like domain-containing protein [Powellomyces hirtus]
MSVMVPTSAPVAARMTIASSPPPTCSVDESYMAAAANDDRDQSSATKSGSVKPTCASPQKKKPRVDDFETELSGLSNVTHSPYAAPAAEVSMVETSPLRSVCDDEGGRILADVPPHKVTWAVSTEKGYKYTFGKNRLPIHPEMEDVHWPTTEADGQVLGEHSTRDGTRLFVLADGHGGVEAPRFFVNGAMRAVTSLLESQQWDFGVQEHQNLFRAQVHTAFQILDASYSSKKVEEYRKWIDAGGGVEGATAAVVGEKKPVDDGCTLIVNVVANGWIVNMNVGDSRTVVGVKQEYVGWEPVFHSSDHNMTHSAKIHHIQRTGGQFIYPYGTLKAVNLPLTSEPPAQPYTQLAGKRIYRPPTPQIRAVGVSHRRTLNLSATMGDLLFKVEPAVISCLPDVEFIPVHPDQEYVLVVATDGVWDHMRVPHTDLQNQMVIQHVGLFLDCDLKERTDKAVAPSAEEDSPTTLGVPSPTTPFPMLSSSSLSSAEKLAESTPVESSLPSIEPSPSVHASSPPPSPPPVSVEARCRMEYCRRLALASRTLVVREPARNTAWNDAGMESLARLNNPAATPAVYSAFSTDRTAPSPSPASPSPPSVSAPGGASSSPTFPSIPDLFYPGLFRYDDATAFVIHLTRST